MHPDYSHLTLAFPVGPTDYMVVERRGGVTRWTVPEGDLLGTIAAALDAVGASAAAKSLHRWIRSSARDRDPDEGLKFVSKDESTLELGGLAPPEAVAAVFEVLGIKVGVKAFDDEDGSVLAEWPSSP